MSKIAGVLATVALAGCTSVETINHQETESARSRMAAASAGKLEQEPPGMSAVAQKPHIRVHSTSYLSVSSVAKESQKQEWLASKKVTLAVSKNGMQVEQLINHFGAQGVRVAARVPVSGLVYRGLGVTDMDAASAVKIVFGSVGLDVEFDDGNKTVVLKPLENKTWYLGIANRKSSFRAGRAAGASGTAQSTPQTNQASGTASSPISSAATVQDNGAGSIEVTSDFWKVLKDDIKARLSVMMPRVQTPGGTLTLPALPTPLPGPVGAANGPAGAGPAPFLTGTPLTAATAPAPTADGSSNGPLEKIEMGTMSINEETGAVSVQAPNWLLDDIDRYMQRIIDAATTTITFTGEIVAVETSSNKSSGLDLAGFAKFAAGRYKALVSNNPLGGVTVSFPNNGNIPSLSANATLPGMGSLLGITSEADGLQIFNAYLSQFGNTKVIQRPVLATTSSVPGEFQRITTRYYNNISQQAATGGTGSAAVGTTNSLIPVQLGTLLRVVPLYNPMSRTIRTQLSIQQSVQTGVQNEPQLLTVGTTVQQVNTAIPIVSRMSYAGETVLRDGDLIVVGGMVEDSGDDTDSGIRGTDNTVLAPVTRQGVTKTSKNTYYIAMRVTIEKKE